MTTHWLVTHDEHGADGEDLAEGGTWLLDLVAAVDHLRRGHRPGLTVWDAIEEALRWSLPSDDSDGLPPPAHDPLQDTLRRFVDSDGPTTERLQAAVRRWVVAMADRFNDGHHWPHPAARRGFPPPLHTVGDVDDHI